MNSLIITALRVSFWFNVILRPSLWRKANRKLYKEMCKHEIILHIAKRSMTRANADDMTSSLALAKQILRSF